MTTGNAQELRKTIGLYGAVALAMGIVLGAGMLSLPGLVYREAGGWAVASWLLDGVLVAPLLFVFAVLGRRFPNAGGVAGFVGAAFPSLKPGCSYLLAGTFSLGLPGIAITGASYIVAALGIAEPAGQAWITTGVAALIVLGVLSVTWLGGTIAGTVQNVIVTLLVGCLVLVTASSMPFWHGIDFSVANPTWLGVWSGMGLAFFAYTGWEMLAFTAEEFRNPRRDFPLAVGISFVLILALYLGAALAVQALVPVGDAQSASAPFLAVVAAVFDHRMAGLLLAAVVVAIIVTNLNGAAWAASRLLFDIGRSGFAPSELGLGRLSGASATPRRAIVALGTLMGLVLGLHGFGLLDLADLLRIAGQNFFLLYTLSIAAYLRIDDRAWARVFGLVALAVCAAFAGVFGWGLIYAAVLFAMPYGLRQGSHELVKPPPATGAKI